MEEKNVSAVLFPPIMGKKNLSAMLFPPFMGEKNVSTRLFCPVMTEKIVGARLLSQLWERKTSVGGSFSKYERGKRQYQAFFPSYGSKNISARLLLQWREKKVLV